jgi:short-subunit dehydrogenase
MTIKDKIVIVTGASMGIGAAVAKELSARGGKVVLAARSKDKIQELAKELHGSVAIVTDMADPESIKNLIAETVKKFGRVDVLVNNAGQGIYGAVESVGIDDYRKIIEVNILGPLIAMQEVVPVMRKQGGGVIVNTGSMVSKNYFPYLGAYASTKYALNALMLTARAELEKDNIIVSVMHPTMTLTDFGKNSIKTDAVAQTMQSRRREGMPEPDTAEYVAKRIALAIESRKAEVYAHDEMEKK